ncbi:MAG: tail fiber domain-containing protein [Candidatus Omnitrophota bacterium]
MTKKKCFSVLFVILMLFVTLGAMADDPKNEDPEARRSELTAKTAPGMSDLQGTEAPTITFYGILAGANNTGGYNTFIGTSAGEANTNGHDNNFLGCYSGYGNTTGHNNIYIGSHTGQIGTGGVYNVVLGNYAGNSIGSSHDNTLIGSLAGYSISSGNYNTFVGSYAGTDNDSGYDNTFVGYYSGSYNSAGYQNTFLGKNSGYLQDGGNGNTFIGYNAGNRNQNGIRNVFLGADAGYYETGSNKLYISNSNTDTPLIYGEFDNSILKITGKLGIGRTPSYPIHMSSGAYCSVGGTWTNASSRSLKENIRDLSSMEALDTLKHLNPVKYNYKVDKTDKHVGFIAEDVPELVATADRKGLSAMDVTAVLTKVVQEQQNMIQAQQKSISDLKTMISDLKEQLSKIGNK